jgi:MFS family permease
MTRRPKRAPRTAAVQWSRLLRRFGPQKLRPSALVAELDTSLEHLSYQPISSEAVHGLRYFWFDGLFASISLNFYANFVTLFALAYGASNAQVGQLTAIASLLAALSLFPGVWAVGALGRRKPIVILSGAGVGRFLLLVWACVPFFIHNPRVAIWGIIIINALITFMSNFGNPAWTSMVADIVPLDMRGRYFSSRNLIMNVMALVVVPLGGWLVTTGNGLPGLPFGGYQLVFFLAFVTGMVSTFSFQQIKEKVDPNIRGRRHRWLDTARTIKNTPGFMGFVVSAFVWNVGLQIAGPFFNVYLVSKLGANTTMVGLLTSVTSVFALIAQPWLGRLTDRRGNMWMLGVTGLLIPFLPLAWAVVGAPWQVIFINIGAGILWTGYNLANFNLLLEMAPNEARADAAAFYQFVVAGAAIIGPLLGGYLADAAGFKLIFVLSAAWRWLGVFAFLWLAARPVARARKQAAAEG